MSDITLIFVLLVAFQVKHFLADYPLQTNYHLGKFAPDWSFVKPLAGHCSVHAAGTFIIAGITMWKQDGWQSLVLPAALAALDFCCHFTMDRIKAGPKWLGRFSDKTKPAFWICLGADQGVHHLTHYGIIWILMRHGISP